MLLTKNEMLTTVRAHAGRCGGCVVGIGGDCHAVVVGNEVRALIALKESEGRDGKLWVGWPVPLADAVTGTRSIHGSDGHAPHPARANIIVCHLHYRTLVLVSLPAIARDIQTRHTANRRADVRRDFNLKMVGYKKYVLQTDASRADVPLEYVDEQVWDVVSTFMVIPRADLEGNAGSER